MLASLCIPQWGRKEGGGGCGGQRIFGEDLKIFFEGDYKTKLMQAFDFSSDVFFFSIRKPCCECLIPV